MKNNALLKYYQMMGKKDSGGGNDDYIKDGLVFHLDCFDAKPSADGNNWIWNNRIDDGDYTMTDCVKATDGGLLFNGISSRGVALNNYILDFSSDTSTIETVYKTDSNSGYVICSSRYNSIVHRIVKSNITYSVTGQQTKAYVTDVLAGLKATISINVNNCIINGNKYSQKKTNWIGETSDTIACEYYKGAYGAFFKGKIYAIRIYNRLLSEEEMLHNQEIDNKRFNLGIEPPKYIQFEDPEVAKICVQNFSSDGVGVTYDDAEKVTDLGAVFQGNKNIISFNELEYFTGLKDIKSGAFSQMTELKSIKLPINIIKLDNAAFDGDIKLTTINLPSTIVSIRSYVFQNTSITNVIDLPYLNDLGEFVFTNSKIKEVNNLGNITSIKASTFDNCNDLTIVKLQESVTKMERNAFASNIKLNTFICKAINPPITYQSSLIGLKQANIYVPDQSVEAYKTAPIWSAYANNIKPLSTYVEPTNN